MPSYPPIDQFPKPPFDYRFEFFKPGKKSYTSKEVTLILGLINRNGYEVIHCSPNIHFIQKTRTADFSPQDKPFHVQFKRPQISMDFYLGKAKEKHGQVGYLSIAEDKIEPNPYDSCLSDKDYLKYHRCWPQAFPLVEDEE